MSSFLSAKSGEDCPRGRMLVLEEERGSPVPGATERTLLDYGVEELRLSEEHLWRGGRRLEPSCKRPVHGRRRGPGRSIGAPCPRQN
jgi:hypothetical protein